MRNYHFYTLGVALLVAACEAKTPMECPSRGNHDAAVFMNFSFPLADDNDKAAPTCLDKFPASRIDATAEGPGRDESFAASQPHVIPWTNVTLEEAAMACGRGGKFLCSADMLYGSATTGPDTLTAPPRLRPIEDYDVPNQPGVVIVEMSEPEVPLPGSAGPLLYISSDGMLMGSIVGDYVFSDRIIRPLAIKDFRHPLVGFRCCIDSRMRSAFSPLPPDERYVLATEPIVPIQGVE